MDNENAPVWEQESPPPEAYIITPRKWTQQEGEIPILRVGEPGYKSRTVAIVLCLFLGGVGAHEFYLRRNATGVIMAVFFWTFIPALIALVQLFIFLFTNQQKWDARHNRRPVYFVR